MRTLILAFTLGLLAFPAIAQHQHGGTPVGRASGSEHPERIPTAVAQRLYITNYFNNLYNEAKEVGLSGNDLEVFIERMITSQAVYAGMTNAYNRKAQTSVHPDEDSARFGYEVAAFVERTMKSLKSSLTPTGYASFEQRIEMFKSRMNISETEAIK